MIIGEKDLKCLLTRASWSNLEVDEHGCVGIGHILDTLERIRVAEDERHQIMDGITSVEWFGPSIKMLLLIFWNDKQKI